MSIASYSCIYWSQSLDPAANLTFDLTLTQQQQADRAQVVLPYARQVSMHATTSIS